MDRAWAAKNRLLEMGVPLEQALYLLPNAKALRFHESGSLLYLAHKWVMRTCFNAQEEIYRASMDELEQVRARPPAARAPHGPALRAPPRPHHAHLHRGRALLRRAGLAVLPERHAAAVATRSTRRAPRSRTAGARMAAGSRRAVGQSFSSSRCVERVDDEHEKARHRRDVGHRAAPGALEERLHVGVVACSRREPKRRPDRRPPRPTIRRLQPGSPRRS